MRTERQKIHKFLVDDGRNLGSLSDFQKWDTAYFSLEKNANSFWSWATKNKIKNGDKKGKFYSYKNWDEFVKTYCCDLSWAKTTQYCGGSGGGSQSSGSQQSRLPDWVNYPCVVELAKSKGVSLDRVGAYLIGDFRYFANGRKGILSTGKVTDFTCNDPEFKTSSSGSQSTQIPSELKDIDGVKKFQDWLDINHPGWHRKYGTLNKNLLRGYGKYGPNTIRAWNKYKDEYLKTSNSTATPSNESPSNWMDSFPSCVKGLKGFYNPPNNYFFGFGTDK